MTIKFWTWTPADIKPVPDVNAIGVDPADRIERELKAAIADESKRLIRAYWRLSGAERGAFLRKIETHALLAAAPCDEGRQ